MSSKEGHNGAERERVVGILGGMGPEATVDLMRRVIRATPAHDDVDHLRMLVDNNPKVPSRIAALIEGHGPSPLPVLVQMARGLVAQGADFLVMPCNTAHHYHAEVAAAVDVPFLNLMELVAQHLSAELDTPPRVGLLASTALQHIELYEPWLASIGAELVYPDDDRQAALMALILAVKAGRADSLAIQALSAAAAQLVAADVDCLLIACTELSVLADTLQAERPVYDAADVLAATVVSHAAAGFSAAAHSPDSR